MTSQETLRKKQLGQFFTGVPVARLLASLAGASGASNVIDPMVGSGDMLRACVEVGAMPEVMVGVDLDPLAIARASARLRDIPSVHLECADAFSANISDRQFDLVITNPPYIRYQSSRDATTGIDLPTGDAIRRHLLRSIEQRRDLPAAARSLFMETARSYPGTADVAVPAWILSAALVAEEGMLAVVVPQAWLTRNYALPIRDMLDRAFDVKYLIEDGDATWFDDALVRTHLLVARRRPVDGSAHGRSNMVVARATRDFVVNGRLVGDLPSESVVAETLDSVRSQQSVDVTRGLTARRASGIVGATNLPVEVADLLGASNRRIATKTLLEYGWRCGQGLRTGANDFFYVTRHDGGISTARRWSQRTVTAPTETLLPTVRRQTDLSARLSVDSEHLDTLLVYLRGWATARDRDEAVRRGILPEWWQDRYRLLPDDMSEWIQVVADTPFAPPNPRRFCDLSAVAPNARTGKAGEPLGYWYHLPALAPRHRPELIIPRVCGARTHAWTNPDGAVVDANFSTLWSTTSTALPAAAMHAILNSTWVWANLEARCTVLGGGALKVEANDLRAIGIPELDDLAITDLTRLGKALTYATDAEVITEIDWVLASALVGGADANDLVDALTALAVERLGHRST